jgi:hypothetical protein
MKTKALLAIILFTVLAAQQVFAQLHAEQDVTATMDLQPILQLNTNTRQVDFDFNNINDYYAGVTQYGATILKVTSTVNWDMYVIGTSSGNVAPGCWDQQVKYGTGGGPNATNHIPLSALEIRQGTPNNNASAANGVYRDYSAPFPPISSPAGSNSVYVDPTNTGTPPKSNHKYIAGHAGISGTGNDAVVGGSYLTANSRTSDYYYTIDYRIVPGLPAVFPMAFDASGTVAQNLEASHAPGTYAQPGVYTMNVQYIWLEDQ